MFVLLGPVKACTGLTSTRTSALKGCFMVSPRIARDRDLPAPLAITNRRTSVSSRRAGSVVPKPEAVARAADTQR